MLNSTEHEDLTAHKTKITTNKEFTYFESLRPLDMSELGQNTP